MSGKTKQVSRDEPSTKKNSAKKQRRTFDELIADYAGLTSQLAATNIARKLSTIPSEDSQTEDLRRQALAVYEELSSVSADS